VSVLAEIAYPIFQAPIGSAASIGLAAAVSNAGACGSLAMTWTGPAAATEAVLELREKTHGPFAANFVLSFRPRSLNAVLAAGAPA
jgi:NAD(P)H-dependent flavin oxidoreductase YrpB (nitropropane dioxygenase family)